MSSAVVDRLMVILDGASAPYMQMLKDAEVQTRASAERLAGHMNKAVLAVSGATAAAMGASLGAYASFDAAMTKSTAIMVGLTDAQQATMRKTALSLSREGITSASDLAEAYFFLASAGLDAEQSVAALPMVSKFAAAGAFDMALATDLLTDAQSALGLASKDAAVNLTNMTRVGDVLVKANTLANGSVQQFAKSLTTKAATAMRGLGKDIEEGVSILAVYADQGIKGEMAGEKLTVMLREMQQATSKNADQWKAMGLAVYDGNGKMKSTADLVEMLEKKLAGMSDEQKYATYTLLGFRAEAMGAIAPLIGMSSNLRNYEKALRSAGGTVQSVSDKQLTSFTAQMTIMKNQITAVAIEVGEILAPSVLYLNSILSNCIEKWHDLDERVKQIIVTVAKVGSVLGPTLVSLGLFARMAPLLASNWSAMASTLMSAFKWLRVVGLVAALPFIKIIAVVVLVGAAIYGILRLILGKEGLANVWSTITESVGRFVTASINFFKNFTTNVGILATWFSDNWKTILKDIGSAFVTFVGNAVHNFGIAVQTLFSLYLAFGGWLAGYLPALWDSVFNQDMLFKVIAGVNNGIKIFISFAEQVSLVLSMAFVAIYNSFHSTLQAMIEIGSSFAEELGGMMSAVLRGEILNPMDIMNRFVEISTNKMDDIKNVVGEQIAKAGIEAAKKLKGAQDAVTSQFNRGTKDKNFFNTAADIIAEGMDKMKGPLDGFQAQTERLPDLMLGDTPGKLPDYLLAPELDNTEVIDPLKGIEDQANDTAKALDSIGKSIDAVSLGSGDAAERIKLYFEQLRQAENNAVNAEVAAQRPKANDQPAAAPPPLIALPEAKDQGDEQRNQMIDVLVSIRDYAKSAPQIKPAEL